MQKSLTTSYYRALGRVVAGLHASRGQWIEIAEQSQVPYGTVKNIANGHIASPNVEALEALDNCLRKRGQRH